MNTNIGKALQLLERHLILKYDPIINPDLASTLT